MSNIKAYPDINQCKKLAEILSIESADMGWYYSCNPQAARNRMWVGTKPENADIPCWSLAALLQVLPLGIYDKLDDRNYELKIDMADKMPRYVRLSDLYHSQFPYDFEKNTLLDNVVESIIWLKDNNYF